MPRTKKKTSTKTVRFWVVKAEADYGNDYLMFNTKPSQKVIPGKRDAWGYLQPAERVWRDRKDQPYIHEMCEEGFETATGVTLEVGQLARLTVTVEAR